MGKVIPKSQLAAFPVDWFPSWLLLTFQVLSSVPSISYVNNCVSQSRGHGELLGPWRYIYIYIYIYIYGFLGGSDDKESACQCRRPGFDPWVRKIPWRRSLQPTPVFLPGEFHGQRSLVGYSPWGHKELDTTEQPTQQYIYVYVYIYMHTHTHTHTLFSILFRIMIHCGRLGIAPRATLEDLVVSPFWM